MKKLIRAYRRYKGRKAYDKLVSVYGYDECWRLAHIETIAYSSQRVTLFNYINVDDIVLPDWIGEVVR